MVTARAAKLRAETGLRVRVLDRRHRPRWHEAWENNPDIARPTERGNFARLLDCGTHRPYIVSHTPERWTWNPEHRATPGRLYLNEQERAFGAAHAGRIIVEPHIKEKASPNKSWGWVNWNKVVWILRARHSLDVAQMGPIGTQLLDGADHVVTPTMRHAAAVLATARAAVVPEGGLHHVAAAVGTPTVVIFGAYIAPAVTGYDSQVNLFTGDGLGCGMRVPCDHCRDAMKRIDPDLVVKRLLGLLSKKEEMAA